MARRHGQLSRTILESLKVVGGAIEAFSQSPMASKYHLARWLWNQTKPRGVPYDTRYRRALWRLRKAGLIRLQHNRIELSPEATLELAVNDERVTQLRLTKLEVWDGLWRLVIWDIPERKHALRDRLRRKLAELGFVRIQGSIWVTAYPCHNEIMLLRQAYGLGEESVLYVEARRIEGEERLLEHFHLRQHAASTTAVESPPISLTQADAELVDRYVTQD